MTSANEKKSWVMTVFFESIGDLHKIGRPETSLVASRLENIWPVVSAGWWLDDPPGPMSGPIPGADPISGETENLEEAGPAHRTVLVPRLTALRALHFLRECALRPTDATARASYLAAAAELRLSLIMDPDTDDYERLGLVAQIERVV